MPPAFWPAGHRTEGRFVGGCRAPPWTGGVRCFRCSEELGAEWSSHRRDQTGRRVSLESYQR